MDNVVQNFAPNAFEKKEGILLSVSYWKKILNINKGRM